VQQSVSIVLSLIVVVAVNSLYQSWTPDSDYFELRCVAHPRSFCLFAENVLSFCVNC